MFFEEQPANTPEENFIELWTSFDERYAPFEQRNVDWDRIFDTYAPQVTANTTDDELFTIFTLMLTPLDDGHVVLEAPGRDFWSSYSVVRNLTDLDLFNLFSLLDNYLDGQFTEVGAVRYGVIDGEIGYMHIAHLADPIGDLDKIMKAFRDLRGVVIDLRRNNGGDFANGFELAERFADTKRLAFSTQTKTGPGPSDLGDPVEW